MRASEDSKACPVHVFISYSHKDKRWRDELDTHLKPYLREGSIKSWSDKQITPGSKWFAEIKSALTDTRVAVLLVTPEFLASDFIHQYELGPLLKEAEQRGVQILWVPVRASSYKKTALKDYQAVIDPDTPLAKMKAERDQAWVTICEEIEKSVKKSGQLEDERGAGGPKVMLSNLPERNPVFTGREPVFAQLQEALTARGRAALSGLGGVGKTQTAVEYAHRHSDEYVYTFWATGHSREALVSAYLTVGGLLKLPESDAQNQTRAVDAVKRWLGSHESWLLILDNADDVAMAREFIPGGKNGHVLLTTRAQAVGAAARIVEIQEMSTQEGALLLLRRATHVAEDAWLDSASESDHSAAIEIATQLDGLPLALDQAAAYIEETGCGLSGYLSRYRTRGPELLRLRGTLASNHPDPVVTTWALSFENIEKANPAAAELLDFCAFLSPDGIPEEVFSEGATELGPVLGAVAGDALALDRAISEILKYSLLRRDANARTLEIHRLVQAVLKQAMDEATQRLWAERAVRAVGNVFPGGEYSTWTVCERLLPQAHASAELIKQWGFGFPETAGLLNAAGFYLDERARYAEAEPLYLQALVIWEKVLGPEHHDMAASIHNLAALYYNQGKYSKAEPLYERALAIVEKVLSPEHPDVAESLNGLAVLYYNQGKYSKAEPLYERALAIYQKTLDPEHPSIATSLNNLAALYNSQDQYAKAEPLYERALAIREKVHGPEHPDVATFLNNLAGLYKKQGQYEKAEPLYKRALAIREKVHGPEHPDVANSLNSLAALYRSQDQHAKAELVYERALAIYRKVLGPEHSSVANTLNGLALLYHQQGQYAKAEPLYERALAIYQKALGAEHPDVALCLENYVSLLLNIGRPEDATPFEDRARAIRTKHT